jgi:hypothetical protein
MSEEESEPKPLTDAEVAKRRRGNLVIALALFAFVALVFAVTIARLGGHVFDHP